MPGNEVENLLEPDNIRTGWRCFVHAPYRVAGFSIRRQPAFLPSFTTLLWDGCESESNLVNPV
jgi:hypothetical protein